MEKIVILNGPKLDQKKTDILHPNSFLLFFVRAKLAKAMAMATNNMVNLKDSNMALAVLQYNMANILRAVNKANLAVHMAKMVIKERRVVYPLGMEVHLCKICYLSLRMTIGRMGMDSRCV